MLCCGHKMQHIMYGLLVAFHMTYCRIFHLVVVIGHNKPRAAGVTGFFFQLDQRARYPLIAGHVDKQNVMYISLCVLVCVCSCVQPTGCTLHSFSSDCKTLYLCIFD